MDKESLDYRLIQFVMNSVELSIQIRDGTLSKEAALQEDRRLRKEVGIKIHSTNPFSLASMDYLDVIWRNLQLLKRLDIRDASLYFSAMQDYHKVFSPPIGLTRLRVLKYFVTHPLSTITGAARDLRCHSETVSRALSNLKKNHYFRIMGMTNRWAFGLRSFLLFFDLSPEITAAEFFKSVSNYPFLNMFYEDKINQHHYSSFLLPHDSEVVSEFTQSFKKLARRAFQYWNLQEGIAAGYSYRANLLTEAGWSFPDELSESMNYPELPDNFQPTINRCRFDKSLSFEDFIITNYLGGDCRITSKDLSNNLLGEGIKISPSAVNHRKRKILANRVVVPFVQWYENFESFLRIEITGSKSVRNRFLAAALKTPNVLYYITSNSLILWLRFPTDHIKRYVQFFTTKLKLENEAYIRMVIGKSYRGGRLLSDVVRDWRFGPNGYTVEGLDINPDITDYVLF